VGGVGVVLERVDAFDFGFEFVGDLFVKGFVVEVAIFLVGILGELGEGEVPA
jgi:hypothetical protein